MVVTVITVAHDLMEDLEQNSHGLEDDYQKYVPKFLQNHQGRIYDGSDH